jgi:tRNA nucleotidyltransferase/poly(A) polymerase
MKQISNTAKELESLSDERIYTELYKIISDDYLTFFNILNQSEALNKTFPEFKIIIDNKNLFNLIQDKYYNNKLIKKLENNYKIILLILIVNIFNNKTEIPKYIKNKHYFNILNKTLEVYYIINQIINSSNMNDIANLYMKITMKIGSHSQTNNLPIIFSLITILNDCFNSNKLNIIISNLKLIINEINSVDYTKILSKKINTNIKEIIYNYKITIIKGILEK